MTIQFLKDIFFGIELGYLLLKMRNVPCFYIYIALRPSWSISSNSAYTVAIGDYFYYYHPTRTSSNLENDTPFLKDFFGTQ